MIKLVSLGLLLPFIGTALGSGGVFFLKDKRLRELSPILSGVTAGVMLAASFWSLLIPALERCENLGRFAFLPSGMGFLAGVFFLTFCDRLMCRVIENRGNSLQKNKVMTAFAIILHNLPEGMAVGMAFASLLSGEGILLVSAMSLSIGVAIQNIPEGAIISLPLYGENCTKTKAFTVGVLSGAVEPLSGVVVLLAAGFFSPLMPFFLSFAAGAMIHVVLTELSAEFSKKGQLSGICGFALGFVLMMSLDVGLG